MEPSGDSRALGPEAPRDWGGSEPPQWPGLPWGVAPTSQAGKQAQATCQSRALQRETGCGVSGGTCLGTCVESSACFSADSGGTLEARPLPLALSICLFT